MVYEQWPGGTVTLAETAIPNGTLYRSRPADGTQGPRYVYSLTDHLGNVRAVVPRGWNPTATPPPGQEWIRRLSFYSDYYPFGWSQPGRDGGQYRYGFQGQEKDPETDWWAFQLRMYDGRIGRWMTYDPKRQYYSPYLGLENNPVTLIDPDGGSSRTWYTDGNEQIYVPDGSQAVRHVTTAQLTAIKSNKESGVWNAWASTWQTWGPTIGHYDRNLDSFNGQGIFGAKSSQVIANAYTYRLAHPIVKPSIADVLYESVEPALDAAHPDFFGFEFSGVYAEGAGGKFTLGFGYIRGDGFSFYGGLGDALGSDVGLSFQAVHGSYLLNDGNRNWNSWSGYSVSADVSIFGISAGRSGNFDNRNVLNSGRIWVQTSFGVSFGSGSLFGATGSLTNFGYAR